jgi:hypothetical protein
MVMTVTVIWRSLQGTRTTYLHRNLRFDITKLISPYSYTVLLRDPSFALFGTYSFRFSPSDDYDDGDGDAANVDNDDDNDDDDDDDDDDDYDDDDVESGYLHDTMETCHDLEMNGNRGRRLVRAETGSESGTESELLNTTAKEPRKVATSWSCVKHLITSLYPLIRTGIGCG